MKTALAFLIIGLSSWFEITVQVPLGNARLKSCTTRITQEQGQSLATLFSILVFKYAESKSLGAQSSCDSECLTNIIVSFVKLVADLKNCGTDVIAETVANCVNAGDNTKAAVLVKLTGKDLQFSSQTDFKDDVLLSAALCMLNEVASEDGISIITLIKNGGFPFIQLIDHIPSDLIDQLGITVNNVNGASEALQGLSSLGSAASISSSGNLGLGRPGVVSTITQLPNQIISSFTNLLPGTVSSLLNIPTQLLSQILSLAGLGTILPGTSSSLQVTNSPLDVSKLLNLGGGLGSIIPNILSSEQAGLGSLGSSLNLGNLGLSGVAQLPLSLLSGSGTGITSLPKQLLSLVGNAGNSGIQTGITTDKTGLGSLGSSLNLGNLGLSGVAQLPLSLLSGSGTGITSLPSQLLSLVGNAGNSGIQTGITTDKTGLGSLVSSLNLGNLGLSGVAQLPLGLLSGSGTGITSLPSQLLGLVGNAGNSAIQAGIATDKTDQFGAAVNIVKGAGVQSQGHGSLGSGASVSSSGNLGLDVLGIVQPGPSSSVISGLASGILPVVAGLPTLASSVVSGVAGLTPVDSLLTPVDSLLAPVDSLLAPVVAGLSTKDLNVGVHGSLGSGSSVSSSGSLGLGGNLVQIPKQIISSSSDIISGVASGLPSGVSGLASSASGLASGVASGVTGLVPVVAGLPTQVLNVGGHGSLGSGSSVLNLGKSGAGGGFGQIANQITSSSSDIVSGVASGASTLASGVSGLASGVSGRETGVNIGGKARLSGNLPSAVSSDQLGITLTTGGGLGSGASISGTSNLGLGSVPTQIIKTAPSGLLNGVIGGVIGEKGLLKGLVAG